MSKISVHQRKARDFIQRADWDNALSELERLLGADDSNPTLHNQVGDLYLRTEKVERACEHFERAIELYALVGLHNNAVALCKKVMRLRPSRHELRWRLSRLRLDQGFRAEAAAFFTDWLDHVQPQGEHAEALETRCRELVDLVPDDAPVGKILEKLEIAGRYAAAYAIVQRYAQVAADAGDDAAARRYTEKMRSLRVLAERHGGLDALQPAETPAAAAAAVPEPVPAAEPAAETFDLPLLQSLPQPAPAATFETARVDPPAPIMPPDAPSIWDALPDDESAAPAVAPAARAFELDLNAMRPLLADEDQPEPEPLQVAPQAAPQVAADDAPVHEYDLSGASFDELASLLDPAPEPARPAASRGWAERDAWEEIAPGTVAPEPRGAGPAAWSVGDLVPPDTVPVPEAHEWVDELRHSPVWIPTGEALVAPEAAPEAGVHMELENVIDSFREQMARALDGDGAARYDLGVAYYEMGLYNEALAEFEAASRCAGLEVQSWEMLAACLLETGRHTEVIELLVPVAAAEGHAPHGRLGLLYALAQAFEALGDAGEAHHWFQEVARVDSDFKDVRSRLARLV